MYYRQPRYFSDFHCIGGSCKDSCCYGWRIDWAKEEVDKLKSAEEKMSPELRERFEKSFVPNEDMGKDWFKVEFLNNNACPLLTDEGLCRVQKELGAEYLSETCKTYPRRHIITNNIVYCACCSSCRAIMQRLLNDERAMDLINIPIKEVQTLKGERDQSKDLAAHPELKFRSELLEFFYEIIADKRHDVETSIILGALAAQALTKLVERGEADKIPETLKSLRSQTHNGAQLRNIENIKPNYHLRFGFVGKIMQKFVQFSTLSLLNDQSGTLNIDYYDIANARLYEIFKDRPFFLRNIALNFLMEFKVPFEFTDRTILENYSLFAMSYACAKLNMIAAALIGKEGQINLEVKGQSASYSGDDRFVGLTSRICRSLCQDKGSQKAILNLLKEHNFTTPAYLALLVK